MRPEEQAELTAAAIARLAGVGRAAVSNWRRRYPDFPRPVGGTPTSPTFSRAHVVAWMEASGKADQLATAGRTDTGTERITDTAWSPDRGGDRPLQRPWGDTSEDAATDLTPGALLAKAMASLLPRSTIGVRPADHDDTTVIEVDDAEPAVVLDPACADGTALMAVADRFGARVKVAGQEIDADLAQTAMRRLGSVTNEARYDVYVGDSLADNQLAAYLGEAAAVVCEPPFDSPEWPAAELTTDPRWEFGIPAPRDGELAWVQHCYAHLRPRGVAVVAVSQRTCLQPSGEQIRRALVRSGVLRAVISLPKGMSSVPGTDICLWLLQRPPGSPDQGPVRLVDLSGLGNAADVPRDFAAWRRLFDEADRAIYREVPRLDLLDRDANLLPSRYVAARTGASANDVARITARLEELYAKIGQGLPRFDAAARQLKPSHVTLGELERAGALTVRPRDANPRKGDVLLRTHGRPPTVATGTKADDTGVAQIVEIDEARLDPYFVATFLKADVGGLPVANTLGAINRDDLKRCRIPRMPLVRQSQYGEAFRRLHELNAVLVSLANVSEKVIEQTIHGLITGALAPDYTGPEGETSTR